MLERLEIVIPARLRDLMARLGDDLRRNKHEARSLDGHVLARDQLRSVGYGVRPLLVVVVDGWPAGDVDLGALGVFVVAEERLKVLPAVQRADLAIRGVDYVLERVGLAIAPDGTFNVCLFSSKLVVIFCKGEIGSELTGRLDLAAVKDNLALGVDVGLGDIQGISITLRIA